jgi:hypothetical protein
MSPAPFNTFPVNCRTADLLEQLDNATRDVKAAALCIRNDIEAGKTPEPELVSFVNKWLAKQTVQDRYGK